MNAPEAIIKILLICAWLYTGVLGCTVMFISGGVSDMAIDKSWPEVVQAQIDLHLLNVVGEGSQDNKDDEVNK